MASYNEWYSYEITGDTVINTVTYHKLNIPFVLQSDTSYPLWTSSGYRGCIRQDTASRKVYIVPPSQSAEQLLYDFNLNVSDTVKGYLANNCTSMPYLVRVDNIDSILINGDYRKRWRLYSLIYGPTAYFIEGIGSTSGLLETVCGYIDVQVNLVCFKQNDTTLYPNASTGCNTITAVNNITTNKNGLIIYPNPAHNKLNIECKMKNAELKMYDITGRMVREEKIHSPLSTFNFQLSRGVYFVRVSDGERVSVQKLVVE
jgi:hypothetical protein